MKTETEIKAKIEGMQAEKQTLEKEYDSCNDESYKAVLVDAIVKILREISALKWVLDSDWEACSKYESKEQINYDPTDY